MTTALPAANQKRIETLLQRVDDLEKALESQVVVTTRLREQVEGSFVDGRHAIYAAAFNGNGHG